MSGGTFDYNQYAIKSIAEDIEALIKNKGVYINDDETYDYKLSDETLQEFQNALDILNKAYVYAQRIDWLLSDDDSEETFHKRLKEDLETIH